MVTEHDAPLYWTHLEVPAEASHTSLDTFLHETWRECGWHLSALEIGGVPYAPTMDREGGFDDKSMRGVKAGQVLSPQEAHHLAIAYDKSAGVVRWLVDDVEVYRVDRLGYRIDRQFMTIDHEGVETIVSPNQLACGMAMFTLLDAYLPSQQSLVRLSTAPSFYFNPAVGEPTASTFVDDALDLDEMLTRERPDLVSISLPSRVPGGSPPADPCRG